LSTKFSSLPPATLPLTGNEQLPIVTGGQNLRVPVAGAQVLLGLGDLPTNATVGQLAYVADAAGGPVPVFWNGSAWTPTTGSGGGPSPGPPPKPMGPGIWILAIGPCVPGSNAAAAHLDRQGFIFTSDDGFNWSRPVTVPLIRGGISGSAYANGCFLVYGQTQVPDVPGIHSAIVATTSDPRVFDLTVANPWETGQPSGWDVAVEGSIALPPTSYDNNTNEFSMNIIGVGPVTIFNPIISAVTPTGNWPIIGQRSLGGFPVLGMGTKGLVEVRLNSLFVSGTSYPTDFAEVRPYGSSNRSWQAVISPDNILLAPTFAAGLFLTSLLWGPVKVSASQFLKGSN